MILETVAPAYQTLVMFADACDCHPSIENDELIEESLAVVKVALNAGLSVDDLHTRALELIEESRVSMVTLVSTAELVNSLEEKDRMVLFPDLTEEIDTSDAIRGLAHLDQLDPTVALEIVEKL